MTEFDGPGGLSLSCGDADKYAMWDAAYVLGSLSSAERREYEAHLSTCPLCREAVTEISGMPALLAQLDRDDVTSMDERGDDAPQASPLPPELLASLLAKVSRQARRSRLLTWTLTAAAATVLATGVFVAIQSNPVASAPAPQADASALYMTPVRPVPLSSTVSLTRHDWGTSIQMNSSYSVGPADADRDGDAAGDTLAMVAVGRDGSHSQLATWVALDGVTASLSASTSMPMDQIAAVQIISADTGTVLLQRNI
jgi:hypothetical protein